jgi:ribosome-associated protein
MEDLQQDKTYSSALGIQKLLAEHNGGDALVIDLRHLAAWTDFFIIATVTSNAHLGGLQRHIKDFAIANKIEILNGKKRDSKSDEWDLIDLGNIIVHLMTEKSRSFYDIENLYSDAKLIRIDN